MNIFTPSTEQVRDAYVRAMRNAFIASAGEHRDEFDRWLEGVKSVARKEALAQARAQGWRPAGGMVSEMTDVVS